MFVVFLEKRLPVYQFELHKFTAYLSQSINLCMIFCECFEKSFLNYSIIM